MYTNETLSSRKVLGNHGLEEQESESALMFIFWIGCEY